MCPLASDDRRTRTLTPRRQKAVLLLPLAAGAFVCGCQKSAADNAPGAGAPPMQAQVQIAPAVKIPVTTEDLFLLETRHAPASNSHTSGLLTQAFGKYAVRVRAAEPAVQAHPL